MLIVKKITGGKTRKEKTYRFVFIRSYGLVDISVNLKRRAV